MTSQPHLIPGEVVCPAGELETCPGRERVIVRVENGGDRPIQVGSHYHFAQANPALAFDREAARGFRLDLPPGTSLRFEPGVALEVTLVALGGRKRVPGLRLDGQLR